MLKLIFKSLWARRRRNGWLLAELILVTLLTWYITDPVFVLSYNRSLPLGYNPDGLLIASICNLPSKAPGYLQEESDSLHMMRNLNRMLHEVRNHPDVQSATPLFTFAYPGSGGCYTWALSYDTLECYLSIHFFTPRSDYFKTFGFEVLEGKTLQDLDNMDFQKEEIVITNDMPRKLANSNTLTGKQIYADNDKDTTFYRVKAMVERVRARSFEQWLPTCFQPQVKVRADEVANGNILIRLRPEVSEQRFLHDFRPWAQKHLRAGNLYIRDAQSYQEQLKKQEYGFGVTNIYRMNIALAVFFLINLVLGVTGTFWLQTRSRHEEVGIMMSYGASRRHICRLLMGEGAVLASFAWLVGCLIYLQYGISEGNWYQQGFADSFYWINDFWLHYGAVSLIVYIVIVSVVLLGVYIPAYRISRIQPTDALRDE